MENKADVIIIGAGACGLYAARLLSQKGKKVILLEAMDKTGGRIRIITGRFSRSLDAGPEFIHGNMPITESLFKESGATYTQQEGNFYKAKDGKIFVEEELMEGWGRVLDELRSLKSDMTMSDFLQKYFKDEPELRENVTLLTDGFDAADSKRLSAFSVRKEWENESIQNSYEADGSYKILTDHLTFESINNGCQLHLNTEVKEIFWQKDAVRVQTSDERAFEASQVLVTVSLGMLTSSEKEKGHINFTPAIKEKIEAAKLMGFGSVIKVNLEFRNAFWNDDDFKDFAPQLPGLRFINDGSEFPVWWTKSPETPFLVGWVGGERAGRLKALNDNEIYEKAINSLCGTMNTSKRFIAEQLVAGSVSNWGADPYTKGAYSYETPDSAEARKILAEPLEQTLYFAGEALGEHSGTVESALESAEQTVKKMLG